MRRQDKYPNTDIFHYENLNPRNRITTDCVVRAIAKALEHNRNTDPWKTILDELTDFSKKTGYSPTDKACYSRFLEENGFIQHKQLRHENGTKYTLKEFIKCHPTGTWLVKMPNHLTVVVDGVNYDIWDCTKTHSKIGVFWEMKNPISKAVVKIDEQYLKRVFNDWTDYDVANKLHECHDTLWKVRAEAKRRGLIKETD